MEINKQIFIYLIFFIFLIILYSSCGIPDTSVYFQEPKNLTYDESSRALTFDGYNQEEDNNMFLLVGYDIYYYFDDPKNALIAQVRKVYSAGGGDRTNLFDFSKEPRFDTMRTESANDVNLIYEWVTCPVDETASLPMTSLNAISGVLTKGNSSNVVLYLDNYSSHNPTSFNSSEYNPKVSAGKLYMREIYPNAGHYFSQTWYTLLSSTNQENFMGFYDPLFYQYIVPASAKISATEYYIYFYAIAKGFNSYDEKTRGNKITQSIKSNIIKVKITLHPWP